MNKTSLYLFLVIAMVSIMACNKKKDIPTTTYTKAIQDIVASYNAKCPIKNESNGTTINSVTYKDSAMVFVCEVSDEGFVTTDINAARNNIITSMSDNLKEVLTKGKCSVVYKYIAPNDSAIITILPQEIETTSEDKQ